MIKKYHLIETSTTARLFITLLSIFAVTTAMADPPLFEVTVVNPSSAPVPVTSLGYRVVGLTPTSVTPNKGIGGMSAACDSAFPNMGARMCTTLEVIQTPGAILGNLTPAGTIRGWIQPVGITRTITYDPGSQDFFNVVTDTTGLSRGNPGATSSLAGLSCARWLNHTVGFGAVYAIFEKAITTNDCTGSSVGVTCCAP